MTDETTQTGDESAEITISTHNPRNDDIESIASRSQPQEFENEEQDSEATNTESSETIDQQASDQTEEQEELLTLKVDGEEIKRSKKEVLEAGIKALQKESAADKRLREATELLNQVKQNTRPPSDVAAQNQQPSIDAELIQKIQYGDQAEASEALENLMSRNKFDPSLIGQMVQQQVTEQITVTQIQQRFQSEFSDILADPYLTKLAADKADERLRAGEPNTWDTYKAAAEEVKAWKGKFSAPVDSFADKKDRKRSLTVVTEASAKKALPEEDPPESVADVINNMRRARKQFV